NMENLLLVLTPQVKMLTIPQETDTAHVSPCPSTCVSRFFTNLRRNHILFSLATLIDDAFVIFKRTVAGEIELCSKNGTAIFDDLGQLWLGGKPSTRKFLQSEAIKGKNTILGQIELQVKFGWLFGRQQSFIGLLTDVHMWDNMRSSCEIQRYTNHTIFTLETFSTGGPWTSRPQTEYCWRTSSPTNRSNM
uniref:Pentraxin (PTX) domain-containing protein n=1 Tax=Oncorhynchus kisutch TaxID=8019 RepID=A0A8C7D914_ONCKI